MKKQKVAAEEQGAQEPKTKRKRKTKVMSKKARETLQDSIRAIDTSVLVSEVVTALKEQCCDGSLTTFTNELCEANELLKDLVDYHRDIFATLHADCKKEKNCQIQFQMKWYSHCSAFLLEEKYPLNIINLEEDSQPGLAKLRQAWLDFCKEHGAPIPASRPAMMSFSTAMYNSLLEHVSSFQSSKNDAMDTGTTSYEVTEEDGVYYRFGGGALCEMLHCRYNQIRSAMNKNLMSIKISILQAINTKDKSDVPGYLKYQDRGYMYFPHKVFIPFLQEVDTNLKKVVDPTTFNEHGDNLIKIAHDEIKKQTTHKAEFLSALSKRLPIATFDIESETAVNNIYEELTRKLCNTRIQEFLSATKQELAAKKGLASTIDVNLRTSLLSNHAKLSSKIRT